MKQESGHNYYDCSSPARSRAQPASSAPATLRDQVTRYSADFGLALWDKMITRGNAPNKRPSQTNTLFILSCSSYTSIDSADKIELAMVTGSVDNVSSLKPAPASRRPSRVSAVSSTDTVQGSTSGGESSKDADMGMKMLPMAGLDTLKKKEYIIIT